ncbi:hypothetical protein QTP88_016371 [Uroleucon formosanum]
MLLLKKIDVYLLPLCILLVFGLRATAGQLVRTKYEKHRKQGDKICRQNTECVSRFECNIDLEPQNQQKCRLGNELYTKENVVVRLGEYDFTTDNETQYIDYRVAAIRLHPDYDHATHANDIALVRMNRPTIYNSFIRPICLPKTNMEVYSRNAVVAGWGQTAYGGKVSNVLQEVTVPIWEHDQCVSAFSQPISKTNLCAASYEGGKDSCKGDSGGPLLVQRQDGRWTNVGVVSWGIKCGGIGIPGVYTKVTSYLKWIAVNAQDVI